MVRARAAGFSEPLTGPADPYRVREIIRAGAAHEPADRPAESEDTMVVALEKPLRRELTIDGRAYVLTVSPQSLKLVVKGRRNGYELAWSDLVSGEAALATALNASLGQFEPRAGRADKAPAKKGRARR